jgi:hypothetical protein
MMVVARIIGYSLLTAGLAAVMGMVLFGNRPDGAGISIVLACFGTMVGCIAGAAGEIVTAQGRLAQAKAAKPMAEAWEDAD